MCWNVFKEKYADSILTMITENYLPNLKKETIKRVVFSPLDFEIRQQTQDSDHFHVVQ